MKRNEMLDIFEGLCRAHAMLEGSRSHIPQSQASEQCFSARAYVDTALCAVRRELKK